MVLVEMCEHRYARVEELGFMSPGQQFEIDVAEARKLIKAGLAKLVPKKRKPRNKKNTRRRVSKPSE